ncbi:glutathionylspermidine synthase [Solibacillus sp. R5-41]|uniref:glutathionylspermidine synthase family protein n=1 Tax=Solibacillus sp. R5-41 TaxID=2048654 RepID=UPI000C128685|nr:glutathionylspermidine synthase family protein [Solibacillus sp. R5-41]ATP40776.1 glutathionylspermidine synthase [Solibacillus sp. R5-41]
MINTELHLKKRKYFYDQHPHFFADIEDLEYALFDIMQLSKEKVDELYYATNVLWQTFHKVSKQFKHLEPEKLIALGIREEMIPYLDLDYLPQQSVLARFDFICTEKGDLKAIELNGDTPFLITEAFEMNQHLCDEFGAKNPNQSKVLIKSLSQALFSSIEYLNKPSNESIKIVITGKELEEDFEEYVHIQFLKECLPFTIDYVPISKLIIFGNDTTTVKRGLYTPNMERIDVLYRPSHPLEFLIDDVSADGEGTRIGLDLLELVKDRQLAIINSPAAYVLQSKILLWLIWEQRTDPKLFTDEERAAIEKYMLPTYMLPDYFVENGLGYVKKPVFSREGNTIEIYKEDGEQLTASQYLHYTDNLYVYQQYIAMPTIDITLRDGRHQKKWLIGSFVADGQACGLACRVGNDITEWDSHWLAIGYKR